MGWFNRIGGSDRKIGRFFKIVTKNRIADFWWNLSSDFSIFWYFPANIIETVLVQMLCISPPNLITHGKLTYKLWNFHVKIVYLPCIMRLEVTFSPRRAHGLAHCRLRFHHLYLKLQNVFLFKIYNTIFSFIFIITILTFIM